MGIEQENMSTENTDQVRWITATVYKEPMDYIWTMIYTIKGNSVLFSLLHSLTDALSHIISECL